MNRLNFLKLLAAIYSILVLAFFRLTNSILYLLNLVYSKTHEVVL